MAGTQCVTQILYSTPALVFTKEKPGVGSTEDAGSDEKTKKRRAINTDEENVLRGSKLFTQLAEVLHQKKQYRQALLLSDTATELDESNKSPYLVRAAALIRLGRYREALMELNHMDDVNNARVLTLKTMASWYSGEFEQAAVSASRGNRTRAQPPVFKEMFNSAIGSIERCIGPSAGDILLESSKDIFQMEDEKRKKLAPILGGNEYCDTTTASSGGRKSTVTSANRAHRCKLYKRELSLYLMQLHMGRLAVTNRYLSELPEMPGFVAPNKKGMERINLLIKCVMMDLENRLAELLMDMPMYVYKRIAFIKKSDRMQKCEKQRQQDIIEYTRNHIECMLLKILAVRDKNIPLESIRASHRARNVITSVPQKLLPERRMYLNIVYHLIGVALLEAKIKDPSLTEATNKSNILGWLGIKRKDVIMKNSKFPFLDFKTVLKWAMHAYSMSPSRLERAWLLYIIAVANAAYGNYDGCRNHIRRSVNEARATGSYVWAINGLIIQANSELQLNSKLDAKNSIKEALDLAKKMKEETIIAVLAEMNEAIEAQSVDTDFAAEERRFYKSLVNMMPTHGMKNEMRHILHHRAYVSQARRLHISVRRDSPPNLGDTAEDVEREKGPRLWPKKKRSN